MTQAGGVVFEAAPRPHRDTRRTIRAPAGLGKIAVLSHILPPSPSGHAIVLHRLFRDLDPDRYCLLSVQNYNAPEFLTSLAAGHACPRLPARYHYLPTAPYLHHSSWALTRLLRKGLGTAREMLTRAARIAAIVKREQCTGIIACSGDLIDIPAAYLAARWLRLPFVPYMFDDYTAQWTLQFPRTFARHAWRFLARRASAVIVPNEFLAAEYRRRYAIEPVIVRNIIEDPDADGLHERSWPADSGTIRIVYTGAVYDAHYDAFRNLLSALAELSEPSAELHLFTGCARDWLEMQGLRGPVIFHDHVAMKRALEVQSRADILFLPLAFHSPYPDIIKTSAPGKLGEFLASGRPVLVHAPADSFVSWYFRKYECGVVVDRGDPALLADAVRRIIHEPALRARIVRNARERACIDFSIRHARQTLWRLFQPCEAGSNGSRS